MRGVGRGFHVQRVYWILYIHWGSGDLDEGFMSNECMGSYTFVDWMYQERGWWVRVRLGRPTVGALRAPLLVPFTQHVYRTPS